MDTDAALRRVRAKYCCLIGSACSHNATTDYIRVATENLCCRCTNFCASSGSCQILSQVSMEIACAIARLMHAAEGYTVADETLHINGQGTTANSATCHKIRRDAQDDQQRPCTSRHIWCCLLQLCGPALVVGWCGLASGVALGGSFSYRPHHDIL